MESCITLAKSTSHTCAHWTRTSNGGYWKICWERGRPDTEKGIKIYTTPGQEDCMSFIPWITDLFVKLPLTTRKDINLFLPTITNQVTNGLWNIPAKARKQSSIKNREGGFSSSEDRITIELTGDEPVLSKATETKQALLFGFRIKSIQDVRQLLDRAALPAWIRSGCIEKHRRDKYQSYLCREACSEQKL